jgi:predicted DCC family thiol-disulfide oxidoreductase YuxK
MTATVSPPAAAGNSAQLTLLFDGGCPLCLREVTFLQRRDRRLHPEAPQLAFVDINTDDYTAAAHGGITYREAMGRIHAIRADGRVLRDVAVFREAYRLIGLGWLYAPSAWPGLRQLADALYGLWARWRLPLTRRPSLDVLCSCRSRSASEAGSEAAVDLAGGQAAVEQEQQ